MVFWKKLFTNPNATLAPTDKPFEGELLLTQSDRTGQYRIIFSTTKELDLYELEELCDSVGWARRPIRKVRKAIEHSFLVVSMWEERNTRRRLIGFGRATSDHAFNATIWDVVIHPSFQSKGLGKTLMKYMIRKLRTSDISNITLFADPQVIDFYRRIGFILDPEGIKGMFWYPDDF